MTWAIVREQLRAHRSFVVTALGFVAGTVMLACIAALATSTQASVLEDAEYDQSSAFPVAAPASDTMATRDAHRPHDLADVVSAAVRDGNRFTVTASAQRAVRGPSGTRTVLAVDAHAGDTDWDALLVEGAVPGDRQIAMTRATAEHLGASIGDVVSVLPSRHDSAPALDLVVSGLTHGSGAAPVQITMADAHVAWSQFVPLSQVQTGRIGSAEASWDDPAAAFDDVGEWMGQAMPVQADVHINTTAFMTGLLAAATALAAVAAALALGRSQAQARASWVGTARALGATRTSVLRAGVVEAAFLALTGSALGLGLGWLATTAALRLERTLGDSPAVPEYPVSTATAVAAPAVIGAMLALVIALAPALWAREVTPASALKPRPIGESAARRRVPTWALVIAVAAASVLYMLASPRQRQWGLQADPSPWQQAGIWSAIAIAAAAVLMLAARATLGLQRLVAARLGRANRPWLIAAAVAITGRPRTSATPGLTMMPWAFVCSAQLAGLTTLTGIVPWEQRRVLLAVLAGTGAAALLVAVLAGHLVSRAQAEDAEAMRAWGLTAAGMRAAAGVHHAVSSTAGVMAGALTGAGALLLFAQWQRWIAPQRWEGTSLPWLEASVACLAVIATGTALAAIGGAASALLAPQHISQPGTSPGTLAQAR